MEVMRERDRLWAFGCARRGCDGICIVYLLYGKGVLIGGVYLRFVFVVAVAWLRRDSIESGFRFKVNIIKCSLSCKCPPEFPWFPVPSPQRTDYRPSTKLPQDLHFPVSKAHPKSSKYRLKQSNNSRRNVYTTRTVSPPFL